MGRPVVEMTGIRFGRLVVLGRAASRPQGGGIARWICQCDCGAIIDLPGASLRTGRNKSCGCFRRDRAGQLYHKHGKSKTPEYMMFYDARKRAQKLDLPFSIIPEDISIPVICPVLGIELTFDGPRDTRPSLDRINPRDGYVPNNIQVISFRANRIKSDASADELRRVLAYVEADRS